MEERDKRYIDDRISQELDRFLKIVGTEDLKRKRKGAEPADLFIPSRGGELPRRFLFSFAPLISLSFSPSIIRFLGVAGPHCGR